MSLLTECCASGLDLSLGEYRDRVDPVIFRLLDRWRPESVIDSGAFEDVVALGMAAIDTMPEERRARRVQTWIARRYGPTWLKVVGMTEEARALESTLSVLDRATSMAPRALAVEIHEDLGIIWHRATERLQAEGVEWTRIRKLVKTAFAASGWSGLVVAAVWSDAKYDAYNALEPYGTSWTTVFDDIVTDAAVSACVFVWSASKSDPEVDVSAFLGGIVRGQALEMVDLVREFVTP